MTSEFSLGVLKKASRRCPFVSCFNFFGQLHLVNKFKRFFYLCPFLNRHLHSNVEVEQENIAYDYEAKFVEEIEKKKFTNTYRVFKRIQRVAKKLPCANIFPVDGMQGRSISKPISIWSSNDYLGMSCHPQVKATAISAITEYGFGSGGTRNISGNSPFHEILENTLGEWYNKQAGLLFTSCYIANFSTLSTLAHAFPDCVIFSDQDNHASMIEGIRYSRCEKVIFKHNDVNDLVSHLKRFPISRPKIVAFESINSMSGQVAPIQNICDVAHKYGAITFLDEVHAVGLYGYSGSGLSENQDCLSSVDIISGTLGKTVGTIGGFIVGSKNMVDMIRCYAPGFIFTTSLPPSVACSSIASISILNSEEGRRLRSQHQYIVREVRNRITRLGFPLMPSSSHIIPIIIGDAKLCESVGKHLLETYGIYVQPLNYPTVRFGTERLRLAPTPHHSLDDINYLVASLQKTWSHFGLKPQHPECINRSCRCIQTCAHYKHFTAQNFISVL